MQMKPKFHPPFKRCYSEDGELTVAVHTELDLPEGSQVPEGDDNIAVRAARLLRKRLGDETLEAPKELKGNDIIRIGKTVLRFYPVCGADFSWTDEAGDA